MVTCNKEKMVTCNKNGNLQHQKVKYKNEMWMLIWSETLTYDVITDMKWTVKYFEMWLNFLMVERANLCAHLIVKSLPELS